MHNNNLTSGLTSKLWNMSQPPNSITIPRINTTTGLLQKPLAMLQPLPLGALGFIEKLWPNEDPNIYPYTGDMIANLSYMLDETPVTITRNTNELYERYTIDDTQFKKRHIQESAKHIVIPTDALQTRSMICLLYQGGLSQMANTGSFNVIRWFMLLPSSRGSRLYPVEIKLEPTGQVKAGVLTNCIHDHGLWTMSFEDPSVPAKYIETYTEHIEAIVERTLMQNHVNDAMIYTATQRITPNRSSIQYPQLWEDDVDSSTILSKLRKSLGL